MPTALMDFFDEQKISLIKAPEADTPALQRVYSVLRTGMSVLEALRALKVRGFIRRRMKLRKLKERGFISIG